MRDGKNFMLTEDEISTLKHALYFYIERRNEDLETGWIDDQKSIDEENEHLSKMGDLLDKLDHGTKPYDGPANVTAVIADGMLLETVVEPADATVNFDLIDLDTDDPDVEKEVRKQWNELREKIKNKTARNI